MTRPDLDIKIIDTYQSPKGTVIIIENLKEQSRERCVEFWKSQTINGHRVKGVETHAIPIIPKGDKIALLL